MLRFYRILCTIIIALIKLLFFASALGVINMTCPNRTIKGCNNNSEIIILGDDLNFDCGYNFYSISRDPWIDVHFRESDCNYTYLLGRLELLSANYPEGAYTTAIQSKENHSFYYNGTLMLGSFNGINVPQYLPEPPPLDVNVSRLAFDTISEPYNFTLYGIFDPNNEYNILFYCANASIECSNLPLCSKVFATSYMLTCEVIKADVSDVNYYFVVQDMRSKLYLHVSHAINKISSVRNSLSCYMNPTAPPPPPPNLPTLPYVTNVSGECVSKSSQCVNYTVLTFAGGAFDEDKISTRVDIHGLENAACVITFVNLTTLTCKLSGIDKDAYNVYPMMLKTNITYGNLNNVEIRMGTLLLGYGSANGYTLDYIVRENSSITYVSSSHLKKVTTTLTIIFSILFGLALASLIFMSFNYKIVPRKVWSSITLQLNANRNSDVGRSNDSGNSNHTIQNEPIN